MFVDLGFRAFDSSPRYLQADPDDEMPLLFARVTAHVRPLPLIGLPLCQTRMAEFIPVRYRASAHNARVQVMARLLTPETPNLCAKGCVVIWPLAPFNLTFVLISLSAFLSAQTSRARNYHLAAM
ncbi:hypothetical protein CONLIGDRAFT_252282 [Coniochaeta ligniaria NRRL 30616]|uniref:Uncharacterized protein n=1 Tax=Coniochaeta ligniaria NRRL 30616 TaxID=1408157 RepID=A0A1J7IX67_9PEZI|nr:hypothetical protein CONLIGDRAFT_252282 [Coniochaeta ligniaria NRRL 30616]